MDSVVDPRGDNASDYSDWQSGIRFSYPLVDYITLLLSSTYSVRDNDVQGPEEVGELEDTNDYRTWSSRIATSFALTREVDFTTSAQHIERYSDSDRLEYSRDIFAATLTYSHEF